MRYKPATFILVPSRYKLTDVDAIAQSVFLWLCAHADKNTGTCFPSIKRLSKLCKYSENTIRNRIGMLEEVGLITKTIRKRENGLNMSHVYQIIVDSRVPKKGGGSDCSVYTSTNESGVVQEEYTNQNQLKQNPQDNREVKRKETYFQNFKTPAETTREFFESYSPSHIVNKIKWQELDPEEIEIEIKKFISYWTEPTHDGKRQRWELQGTFDVRRRLYGWFSKIRPSYNRSGKGVTI